MRHKTEPSRVTSAAVAHDDAVGHGRKAAKLVAQRLLVRLSGQAADEDFSMLVFCGRSCGGRGGRCSGGGGGGGPGEIRGSGGGVRADHSDGCGLEGGRGGTGVGKGRKGGRGEMETKAREASVERGVCERRGVVGGGRAGHGDACVHVRRARGQRGGRREKGERRGSERGVEKREARV